MTLLHDSSPALRLEQAFRSIQQTRMAGLPILNPYLSVEAVDFRSWNGFWAGMLITPWFLNFLLLPEDAERWFSIPVGKKDYIRLPAGTFEIFGGDEPELGPYLFFSLFAPVHQFSDQDSAREVAREGLKALLDANTLALISPENVVPVPVPMQSHSPPSDADQKSLLEEIKENAARPHSRRDFLSGAFMRNPDD